MKCYALKTDDGKYVDFSSLCGDTVVYLRDDIVYATFMKSEELLINILDNFLINNSFVKMGFKVVEVEIKE